jgi:hypothetical protein
LILERWREEMNVRNEEYKVGRLTLFMIILPAIEITINNKAVHTAAKPAILSAVPSEDKRDAAIHATMKEINTNNCNTTNITTWTNCHKLQKSPLPKKITMHM